MYEDLRFLRVALLALSLLAVSALNIDKTHLLKIHSVSKIVTLAQLLPPRCVQLVKHFNTLSTSFGAP